jgi:predicted DNA-binding protein YlxM (UPF0122 family)
VKQFGDEMEKIVEQGLLYDYYGELLTEHQKNIYEDAVYNDMSLVEIAEQYNISKQGVHDIIRRCTKSLEGYEEKLGMIQRTGKIREQLDFLSKAADDETIDQKTLRDRIMKTIDGITRELS